MGVLLGGGTWNQYLMWNLPEILKRCHFWLFSLSFVWTVCIFWYVVLRAIKIWVIIKKTNNIFGTDGEKNTVYSSSVHKSDAFFTISLMALLILDTLKIHVHENSEVTCNQSDGVGERKKWWMLISLKNKQKPYTYYIKWSEKSILLFLISRHIIAYSSIENGGTSGPPVWQ